MNKVDLKTIDGELLKQQKGSLLRAIHYLAGNRCWAEAGTDRLRGILHLLDYIQDAMELEPEKFNRIYKVAAVQGLKFICPGCKCSTGGLEEVISLDTAINPIIRLDSEGDHDYGPMTSESDTEVLEYQCSLCGWVPPRDASVEDAIRDCVSLADWLKKQPYNKEKKHAKKSSGRAGRGR